MSWPIATHKDKVAIERAVKCQKNLKRMRKNTEKKKVKLCEIWFCPNNSAPFVVRLVGSESCNLIGIFELFFIIHQSRAWCKYLQFFTWRFITVSGISSRKLFLTRWIAIFEWHWTIARCLPRSKMGKLRQLDWYIQSLTLSPPLSSKRKNKAI